MTVVYVQSFRGCNFQDFHGRFAINEIFILKISLPAAAVEVVSNLVQANYTLQSILYALMAPISHVWSGYARLGPNIDCDIHTLGAILMHQT